MPIHKTLQEKFGSSLGSLVNKSKQTISGFAKSLPPLPQQPLRVDLSQISQLGKTDWFT